MDPQHIVAAAATVSFNWPQVVALLGGISMFLTFIGAIVFKHYETKHVVTPPTHPAEDVITQERVLNLREKIRDMEDIVRALAKDYSELKQEVSSLKSDVENVEDKSYKDIEKLEGKIDTLINMMIRLLSEDKVIL